jgi:hypothetical protein
MQMVFFVHEGKVLVTVGPPAIEQDGGAGSHAEVNEFAISKGGVWVVPRGMFLICFVSLLPSEPSPICFSEPHSATIARARHQRRLFKEERSARSASSFLVFRGAAQERYVRPAVGITSASHQNTAPAAYRCTDAQ